MDPRSLLPKSVRSFYYFVELFDALLVILTGLGAVLGVRLFYGNTVALPLSQFYWAALIIAALLLPAILRWSGAYGSWRGRGLQKELLLILPYTALTFLLLAGLAFASKSGEQFSRIWFVFWAIQTFLALTLVRISIHAFLKVLRTRGWDVKCIVLIGGGALAARTYSTIKESPEVGCKFIGYYLDGTEKDELRGLLPCLGGRNDLDQLVKLNPDQTWIALPNGTEENILDVLYRVRHTTSDLFVVPEMHDYLLNRQVVAIGGVPVVQFGAESPGGLSWMLKSISDRIMAFILLVIFSPLFWLIAVAVLLSSPGPILFRQARHGLSGKEFNIYKFRTMYVEDEVVETYRQARPVDPRITPLGSFLRRTSLDEIPQVINVLMGSMSMVGPRPHPVKMNHIYQDQVDRYMWRHKIKPGITGWAQINGMRGETDTLEKLQKRVEYDFYYIKHWSYWLDIKILLLTVYRVLRDPKAY